MPATPLNLTGDLRIEQGATYSPTFLVYTQDGNPFDLTSYTGSAQLRHNFADATPSASFTCSINDPATSGSITISLTASATAALTACNYHWDCEIASGSIVYRLFEGKAFVSPECTR